MKPSPSAPRLSPLALLIASLFACAAGDAQVIADPKARGDQRPVILRTANGLLQVDITAPSARGVSMNRFTQFDVDANGVIINNGRTASSTALAGWVAANPALIAQPARVIVGEVNGALPSQINGYVEIAGNKADLILANPAGITCNGCGFIHANRVDLATGSTLWNGKEVTGYAVGSGPLQVVGKGLDARGVDAVSLFTQAAQINAGLWAKEVQLTLADPGASSSASAATSLPLPASSTPKFALDVAAIGGMYANKIFLVGTAHGLGARNAGVLQADTELVVTVDGRLENSGTIDAARVRLAATTVDNVAHGQIFGDTIAIAADRLANAGHPDAAPVIAAATRVDIGAREIENTDHALIFSGGDLSIGRTLDANDHASGQAERVTNRAARIESLGDLSLSAQRFDNLNNGVTSEERQVGDASERQYLQPKGSTDRYPIAMFRWQRWSRAGQYRWATDNTVLADGVPGKTPLPDVDGIDCDDAGANCTPTPGGVYPATDAAWTYFQLPAPDAPPLLPGSAPSAPTMSPPQPPAPGSDPDGSLTAAYQTQQAQYEQTWTDYRVQQARYDSAQQAWVQWQATTDARRFALADAIDAYNERFEDRVIRSWTQYAVTRTEYQSQVTASDPARLVAGGKLTITGGQLTNDQSQIIAGGELAGTLQNLSSIDALGTHRVHESGTSRTSKSHYRGWLRDYHTRDWGPKLPFDPADEVTTIVLPVTLTQDHADPGSAAIDVAARRLTADGSSLFAVNPDSGPLYATDPRFTRYRRWISSDAMLAQLRLDPNLTQKRLGDGFIEQKLVREQIAQLTGRRWLPGNTNDEQQYAQLMNSGVAQAEALQLKPGIALSAAQVGKLTSDLVWLVEQELTLADGSRQRVLVPQVYLRPRAGDVQGDGSLISADAVALIVRDALQNSGLLAARGDVTLQAGRVDNRGTIAGANVTVTAETDIAQHGGAIDAGNRATLVAGGDLTIDSSTQGATRISGNRQGTGTASRTNLDRVASVHVSGDGGLQIAAGRDVILNASAITNDGSGKTTMNAGRDLQLGTIATKNEVAGVGRCDAKNYLRESTTTEVGTQISSSGDITLSAGRDLGTRAATVRSDAGTVALSATQDISVVNGEATREFAQGTHFRHSGVIHSSSSTTRTLSSRTDVLGSTVSGATVTVDAGRDLQIAGSGVVSDNGTTVAAQRDVQSTAATATAIDSHYQKDTQSGLMGSGGVGVTIGSQSLSSKGTTTRSIAVGSTVGATQGDVNIKAGDTIAQVGSSVIAPDGDVSISGRQVDITEGHTTETGVTETKFRQSGVTVAISNPVINAVQTAQQMVNAASNTKDGRMKALAAANTAMSMANAAQAVKAGQGTTIDGKDNQIKVTGADGKDTTRDANAADKVGGIQVSISIGGAKSDSRAVVTRDEAVASTVAAGGNVTMAATGDRQHSDVTVQGSQISAGQQLSVIADHAINLQAAANTESHQSKNSNSSASVGVTVSLGANTGVGVNVSASGGKGKANGDDLRWTNASVSGGEQVKLQSGADTTIKGAVVTAPQVTVASGGPLTIESLQDRSTYASKQQQAGGSVTIGIGTSSSANLNYAKGNIVSTYTSVTEQSGIRAEDGGFDVKVAGDTTLKGGAISSTQAAVDSNRNQFSTGGSLTTTDVENRASYEAESVSVNLGTGFSAQGSLVPTGTGVGFGNDSGQAASTTTSGISGVAGDKTLRTGDKETGIAAIFDAEQAQKEINAQTQITQTFSTLAPQRVASYADNQIRELQKQQRETADPAKQAELQQQIDYWDDGGRYRVALHTAVGGLAGGTAGAAGAGSSAALVPQLADAIGKTNLPSSVKSTLIASAGTLLGAAVGGQQGAGAALSETANNFLSHAEARQREAARQQLSQCKDDACRTQAQKEINRLDAVDQWRDKQIAEACLSPASAMCQGWYAALTDAKQSYQGYSARDDMTQAIAGERRQINEQEFLYRQRVNNPFAFGVAKGLMKVTPPALVIGVGLTAYEVTTAVMEVGAADAAVAIARNLKDLPGELRARLNSGDPTVRGEALVDTLAIASASTAIVGRLQQTGGKAITAALEKQAALQAEAIAVAKAKVENNVYRESSLADPSKQVYSATGPWIPAAQMNPIQADTLIERSLPKSVRFIAKESADGLNANILKDNPNFSPPYVPGTQAVVVATVHETQFVRVYVPGTKSTQVGEWFMPENEIRGLTPEQIASKFALPQAPTHVVDVKVPVGQQLRATISNDINIYADRSLGGNGGGGGVQFELLDKSSIKQTWFSNERKIK